MSQEEKPMDLEEFVKTHRDLLTAMGVFAGLTALFSRLEIPEVGNLLAAISFGVLIVLSWELLTKPPRTMFSNDRLTFFKLLIILLLISIMLYLAIVYTAYSVLLGSIFLLLFGSAILTILISKYTQFTVKHKKTGMAIEYAGKAFAVFTVGIFVLFIIALIAVAIMGLLGIHIPTTPTS